MESTFFFVAISPCIASYVFIAILITINIDIANRKFFSCRAALIKCNV